MNRLSTTIYGISQGYCLCTRYSKKFLDDLWKYIVAVFLLQSLSGKIYGDWEFTFLVLLKSTVLTVVMYQNLPNCTNLYQLVSTLTNLYKTVPSCASTSNCTNLYPVVQPVLYDRSKIILASIYIDINLVECVYEIISLTEQGQDKNMTVIKDRDAKHK